MVGKRCRTLAISLLIFPCLLIFDIPYSTWPNDTALSTPLRPLSRPERHHIPFTHIWFPFLFPLRRRTDCHWQNTHCQFLQICLSDIVAYLVHHPQLVNKKKRGLRLASAGIREPTRSFLHLLCAFDRATNKTTTRADEPTVVLCPRICTLPFFLSSSSKQDPPRTALALFASTRAHPPRRACFICINIRSPASHPCIRTSRTRPRNHTHFPPLSLSNSRRATLYYNAIPCRNMTVTRETCSSRALEGSCGHAATERTHDRDFISNTETLINLHSNATLLAEGPLIFSPTSAPLYSFHFCFNRAINYHLIFLLMESLDSAPLCH